MQRKKGYERDELLRIAQTALDCGGYSESGNPRSHPMTMLDRCARAAWRVWLEIWHSLIWFALAAHLWAFVVAAAHLKADWMAVAGAFALLCFWAWPLKVIRSALKGDAE